MQRVRLVEPPELRRLRAHLPFSMWLPPLRQLPYNRRITCPACHEWTWVRAHWLQ
jgi:hypothetical protein